MRSEARKQYDKEYYLNHKDAYQDRSKKRYEEKKDLIKEQHSQWYQNNKDYRLAQCAEYREKNKEHRREYFKKWRRDNRDLMRSYDAKRRAAELRAIPLWITQTQLDEIKEIYSLAKELQWLSEQPLEVDHIYPLQGDTVSGLHVPENLQILPRSANRKKGKKVK